LGGSVTHALKAAVQMTASAARANPSFSMVYSLVGTSPSAAKIQGLYRK
jgi:hypothetical protein